MAKAKKAPAVAETANTTEVATAPAVAAPFAALVATATAPAAEQPLTAHAKMLAAAAAVNNTVAVGGVALTAANNVAARHATLGNLPAALASVSYTVGRPCKVRVPYTQQCWAQVAAVLEANGGTATGAELAAASTGDFVAYAVRKGGWLVAA